jgi:hypothetical protein
MTKAILAALAVLVLAATGAEARADDLVAAVLPSSRSGVVNKPVTVFATLINTSGSDATGCTVTTSQAGLTLDFQATDPTTNQPVGKANAPVAIANGQAQAFLLTFTASTTMQAVDVPLTFDCTGLAAAPIVSGLDTLLLTIADTEPADIIALALTPSHDGVVSTGSETGTGAFVVASIDIGAGEAITVTPNTGDLTNLPVTLTICQTDRGGACMATPAASVTTTYQTLSTATFAVFVTAGGAVPFDPATTRVFVTFTDGNNVVRGKTSVALDVPVTASTTPVTPGGIYVGVLRITSSPAFPQPVAAMVSEDGEFHLLPGKSITSFSKPILRETLQLNFVPTLTLTATGNAYAAGDSVTAETGAVTATGVFSPHHSLVLDFTDGTETGTLSLNYVAGLYQQPSSLAQLAGEQTLHDEAGNTVGMISIMADGTFSGTTMLSSNATACDVSGAFTIIDPNFSVVRLTENIAACGSAAATSFTGLAETQTVGSETALITEVSNPTAALANLTTPDQMKMGNNN